MVRVPPAAEHIDALQNSEQVAGWIFKTARNLLVDFERARATRTDARQVAVDELDLEIAVDPEDRAAEVSPCVRPMIARLPERYREGTELTKLEGLTEGSVVDVERGCAKRSAATASAGA